MDRIMFLGTAINDSVANVIQAQLLFLQSTDSSRDIQMYINHQVEVCMQVLVYMILCNTLVLSATICTGCAASMAAVLLCAGKKEKICSKTFKSYDSSTPRWCIGSSY